MSFVNNGKRVKHLPLPLFGTDLKCSIEVDEADYDFVKSQISIITEKTMHRILKKEYQE